MEPRNYGLIIEPPKETDFIFGGRMLGDAPVQPDANWSGWLPDVEVQNLNGIEPYACVSFGTLNIVEILERQEYGATDNWSDRFLATTSGTAALRGNTPTLVGDFLRKKGCVKEKDLPFDSSINTFEKFYAPIPANLRTLALEFPLEYAFGYEYVPSNYDAMMEALKYSPLLFTTYAWTKNENGLYYRPQGLTDNHATVCYGYVRNNYWLIFDSYTDGGSALKKVAWDSLPQQCFRYTLHRQIVNETPWTRFVNWLRAYLGL